MTLKKRTGPRGPAQTSHNPFLRRNHLQYYISSSRCRCDNVTFRDVDLHFKSVMYEVKPIEITSRL